MAATSTDRPPLAPRTWPSWIGIGSLVALAWLPWPLQRALGRGLGAALRRLLHSRREIAARNLALSLPELDGAAREALLIAHFDALGIGVFEFARAWWGSIAPLRRGLHIEGLEYLQAARAGGRGVIIISGHFTTLEVCGRLLCDHVPLAGMYRPYPQPAMEWAVLRGRARYAAAMFAKQDVRVPFFGQPAHSLTSTHQLARLSGAAVVLFEHARMDDGSYRLRLWPAFDGFPSGDATADTARVMAGIETMARHAPAQYLWIHRRFKRRPQGVADPYADLAR